MNLGSRKMRWRLLLGLVVSLGLLLLAFWRTDPARLWSIMLAADRRLLLIAFLLNFVGLFLRAARWRTLFWGAGELDLSAFLDGINIGYMVNNLFPARLGDLVRSVLLGRWQPVGVTQALSATVVERVLDSGIVLLLFFSLFPFLPLPAAAVNVGLLTAAVVALALMAMLVAVSQQVRGERWLRAILERIPTIDSERWTTRLIGLVQGFQALTKGSVLGRFGRWSVAVWAQTILVFWVTMMAFDASVPVTVAALATVAAALGMAAPSAPAGIGTFEGAVIGALLLASIDQDVARSMAIALHFLPFIALNLAGFWSLARRGLGYQSLMRAASQGEKAAETDPVGPTPN
ncbi:MAG: lysylphosphatidylglycerol synthase transmembrane domain-containing protein [Anaerolineales bacterium]